MHETKIELDDQSPYGAYAVGRFAGFLIRITRALPNNWLSKRLMFLLRGIAGRGLGKCADLDLFGARMRLYKKGNLSEKRALFAPQFFDYEDRQALAVLAKDDAVFVDIGANIGLYSFSVAERFAAFKNTRIISVEPHPDIYRRLAFNKSLNPSLPIDLFHGGIAGKAGEMQLLTGQDNLGETRVLGETEDLSDESITVPIITLSELCEKFNLEHIDGMKVDVEGLEEAVMLPFLKEASDAPLPRLVVIEDNTDAWETDILAAAAERGYRLRKKTRMNFLLERN